MKTKFMLSILVTIVTLLGTYTLLRDYSETPVESKVIYVGNTQSNVYIKYHFEKYKSLDLHIHHPISPDFFEGKVSYCGWVFNKIPPSVIAPEGFQKKYVGCGYIEEPGDNFLSRCYVFLARDDDYFYVCRLGRIRRKEDELFKGCYYYDDEGEIYIENRLYSKKQI